MRRGEQKKCCVNPIKSIQHSQKSVLQHQPLWNIHLYFSFLQARTHWQHEAVEMGYFASKLFTQPIMLSTLISLQLPFPEC